MTTVTLPRVGEQHDHSVHIGQFLLQLISNLPIDIDIHYLCNTSLNNLQTNNRQIQGYYLNSLSTIKDLLEYGQSIRLSLTFTAILVP